jgi:predicted metal-dependent hydrolase
LSRIEPSDPSFDPAAWDEGSEDRHFARGIDRFNAGEYEEAHEEFEMLWLSTQGPDSDFYKGLVQAAIALHHFQRGNLDGAAQLYTSHRRYLAAYLPAHRRIDVQALLDEMTAVLRPVVRRGSEADPRFDAERRPRLRVV